MSPSAKSTRLLNTPKDCDSTTSLSSLFQCLTNLLGKNFFLVSSLNLPWFNLVDNASEDIGTSCHQKTHITLFSLSNEES